MRTTNMRHTHTHDAQAGKHAEPYHLDRQPSLVCHYNPRQPCYTIVRKLQSVFCGIPVCFRKEASPTQCRAITWSVGLSVSTLVGGMTEKWPVSKPNTILNIVPQGQEFIVERLGKYHATQPSGWFIAIPLVDSITYRIDMREKAIEIEPQPAITRDNVSLEVSGNVFIQFVDSKKAAYGSFNPLYAVSQNAQSAMRAAIGKLELDEILHARQY